MLRSVLAIYCLGFRSGHRGLPWYAMICCVVVSVCILVVVFICILVLGWRILFWFVANCLLLLPSCLSWSALIYTLVVAICPGSCLLVVAVCFGSLRLQVAGIVATHLLRVIKLWSCRVPIPSRAVGIVELFLGVIHRPGVRSIVVLAWFKILPCS